MAKERQKNSNIELAAENAVQVIANAAKSATTAIASAALEASKLLASHAQDAERNTSINYEKDHDLLQRVDTRLEILQKSVDKLSMKDETYVCQKDFHPETFASKDDLTFWRNILVSGLLVTIAVGVILVLIKSI